MVELKGREKQIVNERLKKIAGLREAGVEVYSHKFELEGKRVFSVDVLNEFAKLKNEEKSGKVKVVAGRLMVKRAMGSLNFFELQDLKGRIQIVVQKGEVSDEVLASFKGIDSGDIVGVEGEVFKTKSGEISIMASGIDILTKAILPLPDKHKGLKDDDERLRKRYLDVIMNDDVREMFVKKSKFWNSMRSFLIGKGFLEVETPVLENSAGGAAATPFRTHHNALDLDVFLRISMGELWQKKLLVAGYEKTFEIGRQFRNEGMDAEHLQDYTQMEFYWAYVDFEAGMKLVEEMYKEVVKATLGTLKFEYEDYKVDLGKRWEVYDFAETVKKETGVDIWSATKEDIVAKLKELKIECDTSVDKWRLTDSLWKYCRKKLSGPGFLVGHPIGLSPLAKTSKDNPDKVERFQVIIAGSEVGNGYSELNDPIDQEERFIEQKKMGDAGDEEAMDHDEEFVEALKYGMPPACGFGLSERLFWMMMGKPGRECVLFPLMKPVNAEESLSKETKLAVVVLNKNAGLEKWQQINAASHLSAAFGARTGRQLFMQNSVKTKDGNDIKLNIQHAIMVKEAGKNDNILKLIDDARKNGLEVSEFTREMMETSDDRKVAEITAGKNLKDVEYIGALVFGKKSVVDKLTKGFELVE